MTYSKTQAPTVPNSISRLYGDCQRPLSKLEAAKTITATPRKNEVVPPLPPPAPRPDAPDAQSAPVSDPERPPRDDADTAVPPPSARRRSQKRGRALLQVVLTVLAGVTLTGVSLAALSPSHKGHEPTSASSAHRSSLHGSPDHSTAPKAGMRTAAHPTASATTSQTKHPVLLHRTQQKGPHHARLAAKPKAPKMAHQTASKPAKPAAKRAKHIA